MKTLQIQLHITNIKGLAREWGETKAAVDWTAFAEALNGLVALCFAELPIKEVTKEIPVVRDPDVVTKVVETVKEVEVIREVPIYLPAP